MPCQFACTTAHERILGKCALDEVLELEGVLPTINARWFPMHDRVHGLDWTHPEVGRLTLCQLNCYHTQAPDVYLLIVVLALDQFLWYNYYIQYWSHPSRSSHHRVPIMRLHCQLSCKAEVSYHYISIEVQ